MVATDVPGCRDVVIDGENGLLVPAAAPQQLAAAILRLLQDDVWRQRMGQAARERVESVYSDQQVIAQTCAIYAAAEI